MFIALVASICSTLVGVQLTLPRLHFLSLALVPFDSLIPCTCVWWWCLCRYGEANADLDSVHARGSFDAQSLQV